MQRDTPAHPGRGSLRRSARRGFLHGHAGASARASTVDVQRSSPATHRAESPSPRIASALTGSIVVSGQQKNNDSACRSARYRNKCIAGAIIVYWQAVWRGVGLTSDHNSRASHIQQVYSTSLSKLPSSSILHSQFSILHYQRNQRCPLSEQPK